MQHQHRVGEHHQHATAAPAYTTTLHLQQHGDVSLASCLTPAESSHNPQCCTQKTTNTPTSKSTSATAKSLAAHSTAHSRWTCNQMHILLHIQGREAINSMKQLHMLLANISFD
jgi:hypothetical protein